jgi:predicted transcriptional regulator
MTTNELFRKLLDRLPDDATLEDVPYEIYVLQKIRAGEGDIEAGRIIPHDEVMRDLTQWLK